MMLSAGVHTGTRNSDSMMLDYIWRRRNDGVHILNIGKTWEKLMLAARVIVAIENPEDVIAISARPYGMRATLKYGTFHNVFLLFCGDLSTVFNSQLYLSFVSIQPTTLVPVLLPAVSLPVHLPIKSPNSSASPAC